jgi:hypothetical protein
VADRLQQRFDAPGIVPADDEGTRAGRTSRDPTPNTISAAVAKSKGITGATVGT